MSIENVAGLISGAGVKNAASILMARKALDIKTQQGEANVKLIESTKVAGQSEFKLSIRV